MTIKNEGSEDDGEAFALVSAVPGGEELETDNKFVTEFDRLVGSWSFTDVQSSPLICLRVKKMEGTFSKVTNGEGGIEYRSEGSQSLTFCLCVSDNISGSGQAKVDKVTGQWAAMYQTDKGAGMVYMTSEGNGRFTTFSRGQVGTITVVGPNKHIVELQTTKITMERL